jgi:hypothetical protein
MAGIVRFLLRCSFRRMERDRGGDGSRHWPFEHLVLPIYRAVWASYTRNFKQT